MATFILETTIWLRDAGLISQSKTVNAVLRYIKTRFQLVMAGKGRTIQIPKSKVWINIQSRWVALQKGECQMLITPAQPLQTENGRWIVAAVDANINTNAPPLRESVHNLCKVCRTWKWALWVSNPTYPWRLVRIQLAGRGLERRGDPGRKGSDLCSATVDGTELTYRHDLAVGQRLIYMER